MICEYCGTEMEMFDRSCSKCGRKVEYASRKMEPGITHRLPTEMPVKERIHARFKTNKYQARTGVRFLYTDAEFEKIKQNLEI